MYANHSDHAYLQRLCSDSTLEELQRSNAERERLGPLGAELCRFLRAPLHGLVSVNDLLPTYDLPQLHRSLAACFPQWRTESEMGGPAASGLWFPRNMRIEVRPEQFEDFLQEGSRFYQLPDEGRRVLVVGERYSALTDRCEVSVSLIGLMAQREQLLKELDTVHNHIDEHHYLRNQVLRPDGQVIGRMGSVSMEEVALSIKARETLLRNTVEFMKMRPLFQEYQVPLKRGVLLHGPPGTGKTMIGRALAGMGLGTFIYLTAANMDDACGVKDVFRMARRLRPTIIFMEDLDFFGGERNIRYRSPQLGELLAQMDGLEENDGLLVVATTNDLDAIEPALKDRPSRFDIILEIGLPEARQRRKILQENLTRVSIEPGFLQSASEATEGLSGAQVKELAVLLLQQALLEKASGSAQTPRVRKSAIADALAKLRGDKTSRTVAGFAAATKLNSSMVPALLGQAHCQADSVADETDGS